MRDNADVTALFFFSSRRRHTRLQGDWSSDVCSSDLFDYKLAWLDRLIRHAASLIKAGVPAVLAGDYNVVPAPQDIYPSTSYEKNALGMEERRVGEKGRYRGSAVTLKKKNEKTIILFI